MRVGLGDALLGEADGLVDVVQPTPAEAVRERMSILDPNFAEQYRQNATAYEKELDELEAEFKAGLAPLRGRKFLSLRRTWEPSPRSCA